jgi:hypothetical protein
MGEEALLAMIPSVMKTALGEGQLLAGLLTKREKRPDYMIPGEYEQNVTDAQNFSKLGMPQVQYMQAQQNIGRNLVTGIGALRDRRLGIAGIGNLVQRSNDASLNLDVNAANMANANKRYGLGVLMSARQALAQQKLQQQQWNKFGHYIEQTQKRNSLIGAGLQNIGGGFDQASSAMMYDKMNKTTPTAP